MRSPYDIAAIDAVVNIRTPELLAQRPRRENFYSAKMHVETFIEGMRGVRELEQAVRQYGFIGAHFYPHWFELAPDHAKWPTEGAAAHARAVHGALAARA